MVLIFDYDGTLHDTAHLYGSAFRTVYAELVGQGFAEPHYYSDEEMSRYLGMTPDDMWKKFMPQLPTDVAKKAAAKVGEEMVNQVHRGAARLYDGVEAVLEKLSEQGFKMVILSNCHREYLDAHISCFNLGRWFDASYCGEDFGYIPKEDIFNTIKSDYPNESFVMIGDRESDFKVGHTHGLPTVGCAYGFGTNEELDGCTVVISKPCELVAGTESAIRDTIK